MALPPLDAGEIDVAVSATESTEDFGLAELSTIRVRTPSIVCGNDCEDSSFVTKRTIAASPD